MNAKLVIEDRGYPQYEGQLPHEFGKHIVTSNGSPYSNNINSFYFENKAPYVGPGDDINYDNLNEPTIYEIFVIESEPGYLQRLNELINNYLKYCLTGIKVDIQNKSMTKEDLSENNFLLKWIDDTTDDAISNHYHGYYFDKEIYVYRPDNFSTPTILIHEILHAVGIDDHNSTPLNILKEFYSLFHYKLSPTQVNTIHEKSSSVTLNCPILPLENCLIFGYETEDSEIII